MSAQQQQLGGDKEDQMGLQTSPDTNTNSQTNQKFQDSEEKKSKGEQTQKQRQTFKFEIACDHTPEFKQVFEVIYKSNIMYTDAEGSGHSFTSEIQGGAAGNGHNNVVTLSTEDTFKAMIIANSMGNRHMPKITSNIQRDIKSYCQKPQMAIFCGNRVIYKDITNNDKQRRPQKSDKNNQKIIEQTIQQGYLSFLMLKGNVEIKDILQKDFNQLHHRQTELAIQPISMEPLIYLENKNEQHIELPGQNGKFMIEDNGQDINQIEKYKNIQMECLIGTKDGTIYIYDPYLITKANVYSYNDSGTPYHKQKRPEIVRWIEPTLQENPLLKKPNKQVKNKQVDFISKFVVVFEDGCIYIYYKGDMTQNKEDLTKQMIQISTNQGNNQKKEGKNMISKSDVLIKMQNLIEDFDFEAPYQQQGSKIELSKENQNDKKAQKKEENNKECLENTEDVYHGLITHRSRIYNLKNKQLNFTAAYYSKDDKILNPKLIMRFDCHKINDIQCVRLYENSKKQQESDVMSVLYLIAACNDNYVRFFNLQALKVTQAIKGRDYNGQPLSFDVSPDRQLIAIGFEDDSFITYLIEMKDQGTYLDIIPVIRGVGHKNFISCIKFDAHFQINHNSYLQEQSKKTNLHQFFQKDETSEQPFDKNKDEKQQIQNIQNQIKKTVDQGRQQNKAYSTQQQQKDIFNEKLQQYEEFNASFSLQRGNSTILRKLATNKKFQEQIDLREYRLLTGSDDGYVFFWNIPFDLVDETKQIHQMADQNIKRVSIVKGVQRKIPEFKPKFELFLSGYAQVQNLIVSNDMIVTLDNDSTVTIMRTSFSYPEYDASHQEQQQNTLQQKDEGKKIKQPKQQKPLIESQKQPHQDIDTDNEPNAIIDSSSDENQQRSSYLHEKIDHNQDGKNYFQQLTPKKLIVENNGVSQN